MGRPPDKVFQKKDYDAWKIQAFLKSFNPISHRGGAFNAPPKEKLQLQPLNQMILTRKNLTFTYSL